MEEEDPLIEPFIELNQRKIPNQENDHIKHLILAVYMIFLIVGIPIWFYCNWEGIGGNVSIPSEFIDILKIKRSEFAQNDHNSELLIPKFKQSSCKLKFTRITSEPQKLSKWEDERFSKFLELLKPEMSFKVSFATKYWDKFGLFQEQQQEELIEAVIKSFLSTEREERGRQDIFNFIVIEVDHLQIEEEKTIIISNRGIIVNLIGKRTSKSSINISLDNFLVSFAKLIGFKGDVELWKRELNHFYLEKSFEMISQLKYPINEGIILPSAVYKTKLKPALDLLRNNEFKRAFDAIESTFHDPKLTSAAYFPDEHKFAVYLPVYLPLILPILMAFLKEIREIQRRRKQTKANIKNKIE